MKKTLSILSILSIPTLVPLVISCNNSAPADQNNNSQEQTLLKKYYDEGKIKITLNNISKNIFDKYSLNLNEINKIITFRNSSDLQIEVAFNSQPTYDETNRKMLCEFKITDLTNSESIVVSEQINFNFSSESDYIKQCANFIVENLKVKEEVKQQRILQLFKETESNQQFINRYLDTSKALSSVVGITFKVTIPTQTTKVENANDNFIQLLVSFYDGDKKIETEGLNIPTPYIKIPVENQDTFTIFNYEDLTKTSLPSLNSQYFGELLFRSEDGNFDQQVTIEYDFSGKGIVNTLDFSKFNTITFNSSFSSNYITSLIFNPNSTLINLDSRQFSSNHINEVILPNNVENYSHDAFDSSCSVVGIDAINLINNFYNKNTKDLDLRNVTNSTELRNILEVVSDVKTRNKLVLNKVYLPQESKLPSSLNYSINCNELILFDDTNAYDWTSKYMSSWNAQKVIVPSSVVKFDKSKFNSKSTIERTCNNAIKQLVSSQKLVANKSRLNINIGNKTYNLWNDFAYLDYYFYGTDVIVRAIEFNEADINISNSSLNWNFFTENSIENKEIIFTSAVKTFYDCRFWDAVNRLKNTNVIRHNSHASNVISNRVLNLNNFYNSLPPTTTDYYKYLVSYESEIDSINTEGINEIKEKTFSNLNDKWANVSINLGSNIQVVSAEAFYDSKLQITLNGFNPNSILDKAFYYSSLSGNLELTNLTSLGQYAFYGTKITSINIPQITELKNYVFYSCRNLHTINMPKVTTLGNNVFYGCSSLNIVLDFSKFSSIGTNVFANCSNITEIKNMDLEKHSIFTMFGQNFDASKLGNINLNEIEQEINYDRNRNVLDLSNFDVSNIRKFNSLYIFLNRGQEKLTFNEVILPNQNNISSQFKNLFSSKITINKLIWNYMNPDKSINYSLSYSFNNATIGNINEDFFVGLNEIRTSQILPSTLKAQRINLNNVSKIGPSVFYNLNEEIDFINTSAIKEIGARAFNSNCIFNINQDVKLEDDSFTKVGVINDPKYKIKRAQIFSNYKFYNANTKTLDFSSATEKDMNNFRNNYRDKLISGDVDHLILPKVYVINDSFSNLGNIKTIKFQVRNQVILPGAFYNTTIMNKPTQAQTHIVLDLDNLFGNSY